MKAPAMMSATERVMTALRHREPDRVPIREYFWPEFVAKWRREKGLGPDSDIHQYYALDIAGTSKVAADQSPWPSGARELKRGPGYCIRRTGWGEVVREVTGGAFCEVLEAALPRRLDLDRLAAFEPAGLDARYADIPEWVRQVTAKGFCVMAKTGGPWSRTLHLRGLEAFLVDLVEDPAFARELLRRQTDLLIATALETIRRGPIPVTVVWIADDCAGRTAPLFSPALYERLILPELARMCEAFHAAGRLVAFESEGHIAPLVDLILDAGVDALANLEPRAGMDIVAFRERYGHRVSFIGTLCNTVVLPRGTPETVRRETLRTLEAAVGGGCVAGSAHSVGPDVPLANYEAFIRTMQEHGAYPLRL